MAANASGQAIDLAQAFLPLHLETLKHSSLRITGWSMGSLLGPCAESRISPLQAMPAVGDIVLVRKEATIIAHRVIALKKRQQAVITKGDACPMADGPTQLADILGVLTGIVQGSRVCIPWPMRFPWALLIAWNSSLQHRLQLTFPGLHKRLDIFRYNYKLLERILRWIP